jgi:hypothetical protein
MTAFVNALLTQKSVGLCFSLNDGVVDSFSLKWLAGSLTAGNYVTLGEPLRSCSYADSCLSEQEEH